MLYIKKKGSVGYTIVGTPTIVDGLASGFSSSDYLKTTSVFNSVDTFEIYLRVLNPATFHSMGICGFSTYSGNFGFFQNGNSTFNFRVETRDGEGHNAATSVNSNISIEPSSYSRLYGKIDSINRTIYFKQMADDGTVLYQGTNQYAEGRTIIYGNMYEFGLNQWGVYEGGIDLNQSYIKIDGQPWFGVCPVEVKKHQIMGPVGYTVIGSPTITGGVASNLSNGTNYLQLTQQPPSVINSFEFVCRCNSGSAARGTFAYSYPTGYYKYGGFYCRTATREASSTPPFWRYKAQQTSSEVSHTLVCPANSGLANSSNDLVYSKLTMETVGENDYLYSFYQSLDGVTWTLLASKHDTYRMSGDDIGLITMTWNPNDTAGNTSFYARSIDLNNTYIKINGKLWFWQPRETESIVVNGVEVWNKNEV